MINIGFLYNCSMRTNPIVRLSPSLLNRVILMDRHLRESNQRIFFYSPKRITEKGEGVPGYLFEDGQFKATTAGVPRVNGNWTYETRKLLDKGMGYMRFNEWRAEHGIGVYVPYAFSELVANKYETYRLVRGYHETLHPHCEQYRQSGRQLEYFLERGGVFVKPRAGSKGDRIVNLKHDDGKIRLSYYKGGRLKRLHVKTASEANAEVRQLTRGSKGYVIQQGIDTLSYEGSVFDIRVIMFFDGHKWGWIHEARLSQKGRDVSNVGQGGFSLVTEDLLFDLLGNEGAKQKLDELRSESFGLAAYVAQLHPDEIMEVAFDFVIDSDANLRLVEMNTKPGLGGIGFLRSVLDKKAEHEPLFERWVYPHMTSLAKFMRHKQQQLGS